MRNPPFTHNSTATPFQTPEPTCSRRLGQRQRHKLSPPQPLQHLPSRRGNPSHVKSPHSSREGQTPTRKNKRTTESKHEKRLPVARISTPHFQGKDWTRHKLTEYVPPSLFKPQVPVWRITGNRPNFKNRSSFMEKSKLIRFVWKGGEKGGTDGVRRTFLRVTTDDRSLLQRLGQLGHPTQMGEIANGTPRR